MKRFKRSLDLKRKMQWLSINVNKCTRLINGNLAGSNIHISSTNSLAHNVQLCQENALPSAVPVLSVCTGQSLLANSCPVVAAAALSDLQEVD